MVGNARNKPYGTSKPDAKHISPDQLQLQRFEEEYAGTKKGHEMSKSALNYMHKHEGRQPSKHMSTLAYPFPGETVMSKEQHSTKENKKKPLLTAKEKKAAKKTKKDTNVIGQ